MSDTKAKGKKIYRYIGGKRRAWYIPEETMSTKKDMPDFLDQNRPKKVKEIYKALKEEHPSMPAALKAKIAHSKAKQTMKKQSSFKTNLKPNKFGVVEVIDREDNVHLVPKKTFDKVQQMKGKVAGALVGGALANTVSSREVGLRAGQGSSVGKRVIEKLPDSGVRPPKAVVQALYGKNPIK